MTQTSRIGIESIDKKLLQDLNRTPDRLSRIWYGDYSKLAYRVLCETAIASKCSTIEFVEPSMLDEKLCLFAIHKGCPILLIPGRLLTVNMCVTAAMKGIREFGDTYGAIISWTLLPTDLKGAIHAALADARPSLWMVCTLSRWRGITVPLTGAYFAAVKKDGLSLRFAMMKKIPGLIEAAVEQNPVAIAHVEEPDPRMCLDCYRRNKNTFALFDDKGRRFVARRVLADVILTLCPSGPTALCHLSPNLLAEVCTALLNSDSMFPRTYTDTPSTDEIDAKRLSLEVYGAQWRENDRTQDVSSWNMQLHDVWELVNHILALVHATTTR